MLKTILLTMTATAAALSLAASLFLNSILGFFGLAATGAATLSQLRASQQVLEQVKKRHAAKRRHVSKRLVKRSGKRVASTALAAATVGTVGVAVVMTGLEIEDYCKEKESLQEDANLLHGTDTPFDYELCLQESRGDAKAILTEAKNSAEVAASEALAFSGTYSREAWNKVLAGWRKGVEAASGLWENTAAWIQGGQGGLGRDTLETQQD